MKRKAIPTKVQVSVAIRQAWESAGAGCEYFACALCRKALDSHEPRILEHMTPHATMILLGRDPDEPSNLAWVHDHCAARKTNGTKATCADGDNHKIAKAKRLAKATEEHKAVLARVMTRPAGKIKSRGFAKGLRKTFSGKVVPK